MYCISPQWFTIKKHWKEKNQFPLQSPKQTCADYETNKQQLLIDSALVSVFIFITAVCAWREVMMINIASAWAWVMELEKQRDQDRTLMLHCTSTLVNPTAKQVVTLREYKRPLISPSSALLSRFSPFSVRYCMLHQVLLLCAYIEGFWWLMYTVYKAKSTVSKRMTNWMQRLKRRSLSVNKEKISWRVMERVINNDTRIWHSITLLLPPTVTPPLQ